MNLFGGSRGGPQTTSHASHTLRLVPQHRTKAQLEQVITILSATKANPTKQTNKKACEVRVAAFVEMSVM